MVRTLGTKERIEAAKKTCINCGDKYIKVRGKWDGQYCKTCHFHRVETGEFPDPSEVRQ